MSRLTSIRAIRSLATNVRSGSGRRAGGFPVGRDDDGALERLRFLPIHAGRYVAGIEGRAIVNRTAALTWIGENPDRMDAGRDLPDGRRQRAGALAALMPSLLRVLPALR